jgi:hypothetical protein
MLPPVRITPFVVIFIAGYVAGKAGWLANGWVAVAVVALGFALLAWLLYVDRRTSKSIQANVAQAVARRDRLLGRR